MKKFIPIFVIFFILNITYLNAQGVITRGSPEEFIQMLRDRQKPSLITHLYLTEKQAEGVIAVQVWAAPFLYKIVKETQEYQKPVELLKLADEKEKKYKEIPLTEDQVKGVILFYSEMLKNKTWPEGYPTH